MRVSRSTTPITETARVRAHARHPRLAGTLASMRRCLAGLALLAAPNAAALADTYPRQPQVDALHYAFGITLGDDHDEIAGEAVITFRFTAPDVAAVSLDLASASDGKGMTVTDVTASATAVPFTHRDGRLVLRLPSAPAAGEERTFTVRYRGVPAGGLRILSNKFGDRVFFSENWPDKARQWLPMIDHPYDKATSEFLVTAPARYQVVANGLLQEEVDLGDGRRLTHWKQSVPIASWLNAIGVAQFAVHHDGLVKGVPHQTWVYRQERAVGAAWFETRSRQAMEFLSENVGPYPYEKLANVEAAGFNGGTEHASAIFYGEKSIIERPDTGLIAHEIAHQWFGNSVTERDWDDVWLSEGFATYFTLLVAEHHEGRDAFVAGLQRSRATVLTLEKQNPGVAVLHDNLDDMKKVLNRIIYQKGGWTLHMLRHRIGTAAFWDGIRDYYRRYRDGSATTDDFRQVMEAHGRQDLRWFFAQWLSRAGSPVLDGGWRYDAAARRLVIDLTQTHPGDAYRLPIEVAITTADVTRIETVDLTQQQQQFEFAAAVEPSAVVLDPGTWVLMDARFVRR